MYGFLLVFYSNFVPKTRRFLGIRLRKMSWSWNPGQRSLKVIGTDRDRSDACDFLLTFHSNHRPISHRFPHKQIYLSKIANFSHPRVLIAPNEGVPLEFGLGAKVPNASRMGLPDGQKRFKIGLVVLIQYWLWQTDRHPPSHVAIASTRYAYLRCAIMIMWYWRV